MGFVDASQSKKFAGDKEEFSSRLLRFLVMLALGTIFLVVIAGQQTRYFHQILSYDFSYYGFQTFIPYFSAAALAASNSLRDFKGISHEAGWQIWQTHILIGILVGFVLAPGLFFFTLRRIALSLSGQRTSRMSTFNYIVAGSLMVVLPFAALEGLLPMNISLDRMENSARIGKDRDQVVRELRILGFKAQELWGLPVQYGGSDRRWTKVIDGAGGFRALGLSDLTKDWQPQGEQYFIASVNDDTTLTLVGLGNEVGRDSEFENWGGGKGNVQVRANVTARTLRTEVEN